MKSLLEETYLNYLQNTNIKVVSFDIFDTLAMRSVREPEDIFFKIGQKPEVLEYFNSPDFFQNIRVEAEKKARIVHKNLEEITFDQIYKEFPLEPKIAKKIQKIELETENECLHVNPQIEHFISLAKQYKKRVILLSDMYLSSKHIQKLIIQKMKKQYQIDAILVSSEYKKTKYFGSIYPVVLKQENIKAKNLLHIGDNPRADQLMASSFRIRTMLYAPPKYMQDISYREKRYATCQHLSFGHHYRKWALLTNPYKDQQKQFYYNQGAYLFAPALWEFSHWVNKLAKKHKIEKIFCVMREGRIFKKCLDMINPSLDTVLLFASRKSTFLPSMDLKSKKYQNFDIDNFRFRQFTIENFYSFFELKLQHSILQQNRKLQFLDLKNNKKKYSYILQCIEEDYQQNFQHIKEVAKKQKKLFYDYYSDLQGKKNTTMLIDFGGGGTIIKNINQALPKTKRPTINILFYMHYLGYEKTIDYKTIPFFYDKKTTQLLCHNPKIHETLFNGTEETTFGYIKKQNKIQATTFQPNKNSAKLQDIITAFDKGIGIFFDICKTHKAQPKTFSFHELQNSICRLIDAPHLQEASYFGSLCHDEGHGSHIFEPLITKQHKDYINKMGIMNYYYKIKEDMFFKDDEITWHQGTLTQIEPNFISNILSLHPSSLNEKALQKICKILNENNNIQELYMYGAGEFGLLVAQELQFRNIKIKGIIDKNAKQFLEFKANHLKDIKFKANDIILVASVAYADEILKYIQNSCCEELRIITKDGIQIHKKMI